MIIDSHCHLDFKDFNEDRKEVIIRAQNLGIKKIILPGVMQTTWGNIKACCEKHPQLFPCYGLHPYFIDEHKIQDLEHLKTWISTSKTIAIGECGLDFYLKELDRDRQQFFFEAQLDIALEFNLPVVLHARKSTEAVINAIKQRRGLRGMIHSYSGSYEQALKLIDLGFYLSFGGPITFSHSTRLRKIVTQCPLDSILVETDAPDQPAAQFSGKRNEPAFILDVIEAIAELHNTDRHTVSQITANNAQLLFQLD